jgi:6-pyruvoyltetrahydropterin/6-carboxytetrahydropterin synthase
MLVDFGNLKQLLTEVVHDPLDHGFIVHKNDFTVIDMFEGTDFKLFYFPYIPTAENIARWSFEQLEPRIKEFFNDKLTLDRIECWETPTSCAIYPERMH